jgi:very-short-patch-repair endonuclease
MKVKQLATQISRELRKNQTTAEKVFWSVVRNKQIKGHKFLRQHPIFYQWNDKEKFFIADFYCRHLNLIVEINGGIHLQQKDYDQVRSEILQSQKDLRVIRFNNKEVLNNIQSILDRLKGEI